MHNIIIFKTYEYHLITIQMFLFLIKFLLLYYIRFFLYLE